MSKFIYCIVGPSGSGKTTLANKLQEVRGLKPLDSYTDRPKRTENEKGHTFISAVEYDKLEGIVAETLFDGFRYCATAEQIDECDVYVVDPKGIETLKERYKGEKKPVIIYLTATYFIRLGRMLQDNRGLRAAQERLHNDRVAFAGFAEQADYVVQANYDKETVLADVLDIIDIVEEYV